MWKRMLVAHDFSELGEGALRVAAELARGSEAELVLLHVTDLEGEVPGDVIITPHGEQRPVRVDDFTAQGALKTLENIAAALGPGVRSRCAVAFGDPGEQILTASEKYEVDAIVMGTHGRTGLAGVFMGSVAEYVLRRSNVPVVTLRGKSAVAFRTPEEQEVEDELAG